MELLPLCDADEFVGEISAAGVENTREFSQVGFQEFLDRRILLQFLDRLPSKRKVRLLLCRWKSARSPAFRLDFRRFSGGKNYEDRRHSRADRFFARLVAGARLRIGDGCPSGEVYLLHVIDADFLASVSEEGFCNLETARAQLQRKAEEQLKKIAQKFSLLTVRIESMVVVGKPFAEILRIAADLHFSLIVMGIRGRHQSGIEEILFGSTAEKVLRAARIPVVCVPPETNSGVKQ
jgi:nucleotide-binding universal stress UspA family protein